MKDKPGAPHGFPRPRNERMVIEADIEAQRGLHPSNRIQLPQKPLQTTPKPKPKK